MFLDGVYSSMSDADLDASYASSYNSMKSSNGATKIMWSTVASQQAQEILDRLGNLRGIVTGFFGGTRFPQYDAIQRAGGGGFVQATQAQTSVAESASNVGKTITDTVGKLGIAGLGVGVAAVVLLILLRGRK